MGYNNITAAQERENNNKGEENDNLIDAYNVWDYPERNT